MPSSVIRRFDYDERDQRLDIEFVSGNRYSYHQVPARIATALRAATSKGSFFNRRIRDHFAFTRREAD
ncbi:KTSC domain-containing protein [Rhizorhabdus dicambivorans]|uniref:KTSC domain-containing protein n=1 Tax=Rhizorhabdus dicambivorans TaxID=1850238 RepID=A0A2A4G183_9SPHN|nr:KTSC domain-containing protein [Rhizorhabdus dicambivorans]ATE64976.1 KTSC domain-containing protein [Rhizorhabdus dicambivorans]PCE44249.1 KTSC domain-containing protein [Rhizorhabdus dicambivorans]